MWHRHKKEWVTAPETQEGINKFPQEVEEAVFFAKGEVMVIQVDVGDGGHPAVRR